MEEIRYQKAGLDDVNAMIDLRFEFQEEYWGKMPEEPRNELRQSLQLYFAKSMANGSYICYIAKMANRAIGIGGTVLREQPGSFKNPSGKTAYIMNMYTVPSFRRKGISSKILNLLIEDAKEKGILMFELHATEEGEPLYKKNGFELHPEPTYRKFEK